jgi:hypothetical protein
LDRFALWLVFVSILQQFPTDSMEFHTEKTVITKFKIRSKSVVFYPSFELFSTFRGQSYESQKNLLDNRVKGYLSQASSRKIRDMVENWVNSVRAEQLRTKKSLDFYLCFVTLTLPAVQVHCDRTIKRKCLNKFLIYGKRKWKIKNFIWKAEPQKNGNIHFHLLFDRFIDWREIRSTWVDSIDGLGYIDTFFLKHGHRDPNCTDVHGLYKDKKGSKITFIGAYLSKYMSKKEKDGAEKDRPICGRVWGCSDGLKKIECFKGFDDFQTDLFFKSLRENSELSQFSGEYFRVFSGDWMKVSGENVELMRKIDSHYLDQYKKINELIEIG